MEQRGYSLVRNDGGPSSGGVAAFALVAFAVLASSNGLAMWISARDATSFSFSDCSAADWVTIVYRMVVCFFGFSCFMRSFSIPAGVPPKSFSVPAPVAQIAGTSEEKVFEFSESAVEMVNGSDMYQGFVIWARSDQVCWAALATGSLYTFFIPRGEAHMAVLAIACAFTNGAFTHIQPILSPRRYTFAVSTSYKQLSAQLVLAAFGWFSFWIFYKDATPSKGLFDSFSSLSVAQWLTLAYQLVLNTASFRMTIVGLTGSAAPMPGIPSSLQSGSMNVPVPVAMITGKSEEEVDAFSSSAMEFPNGPEIYQALVILGRTAQTGIGALCCALTCTWIINYNAAYSVFLMVAQFFTLSALTHLQALLAPTRYVYAIAGSARMLGVSSFFAGSGWLAFYASKVRL